MFTDNSDDEFDKISVPGLKSVPTNCRIISSVIPEKTKDDHNVIDLILSDDVPMKNPVREISVTLNISDISVKLISVFHDSHPTSVLSR